MKRCATCKIEKEETEFYRRNRECRTCRRDRNKDYYQNNKERCNKRLFDWRKANPDKVKKYYRGISLEGTRQYLIDVECQEGVCPICGNKVDLLVLDHNHATGLYRGALCGHCNRGLGQFRDNPLFLQQAIYYLNKDTIVDYSI